MAVNTHIRLEHVAYLFTDLYLPKSSKRHKPNIQPGGNFYIDVRRLNKSDIIDSCGVGTDIHFGQALHEMFRCDVHLFGPTPLGVDMTKVKDSSYLKFHPWSVWVEYGPMKFYSKNDKDDVHGYPFVTNIQQKSHYLILDCNSLPTIMNRLSHNRIEALKMV